jgi:predicted DNA-binding transcriptional regulator AlpA
MSPKTFGKMSWSIPPASASQVLTPKQAAQLLNLSVSWLAKQRLKGTGPPFLKLGGSVRYDPVVLKEWMRAKQRLNTSLP